MPLLYEDMQMGSKVPQPLVLRLDSQTININPYGTNASGKITAIRVQDIARQKWYNWDNGAWDSSGQPMITPGANNLYLAFYAVNQGTLSGTLTLTLKNAAGTTLKTQSVQVSGGGNGGLEYTGAMPEAAYSLALAVTP